MTDDTQPHEPEHATEGSWTPKLSDKVRTIGYFVGLGLTCIAAAIALKDDPVNALLTIGGVITGGLGVTYNPIRLSGKQGLRQDLNP